MIALAGQFRATKATLVVGVAVLITAWLLFLPRSVTLYDGLGFPDEPYRYVHPPTGYQHTPPPTGARATVKSPGSAVSLMSAEQGPQISVRLRGGSLQFPAGGGALVTVAPLGAPAAQPAVGHIVGNVYRVSSTAVLAPRGGGTIQMRAPTAGQPGPVFEVLTSAGWQPRPTNRVGNDIYQAQFNRFGEWALVQTRAIVRNGQYDFGTPDSFGAFEAVLAIGGPAAIVVIVAFGIRSSRSRRRKLARRDP
ncbi:MAG TPA: hypothetical protein VG184_10870 [Acidimicrobiales bacterium]|nr:hypothetical protein [Acidimicrobiales bacterium]